MHNVDRLVQVALENPQIFSSRLSLRRALARRKQGSKKMPPAWLNDYMKYAHVPKPPMMSSGFVDL